MKRLAILFGLLLVTSAAAQEPSPSPSPSPAHDSVDAMVTLPLAEFEALVAGSGAARRGPPATWAIREATYAAEASDDGTARVAAVLDLEVLADGYQTVPIGGGVAFEKAKLDGADVLLVATEGADRSAVLVPSKGSHKLEIDFVVPAPADPTGARRLGFGIARSPRNRVTLSLAKPPVKVHALGGVISATTAQGARTVVETAWPPADQVVLVWTEPQPAVAASASVTPPPVTPRIEATLSSRYAFKMDHADIEAQVLVNARQGSLSALKVQVPAGLRLVRVREQNGETTPPYTTAANPAGTLVTISPAEPITGERRYRLEVEQPYAEAIQIPAAPAPVTTAAVAPVPAPIGVPAPAPPPLPGGTVSLTTSAGASSASTAVAATPVTSAPPPAPPVTVPLAFLSLPGIDAVSGEFTLAYPASPVQLDPPPEPVEPVRRAVSLSAGISGGQSFSYTGQPKYAVTLRAATPHFLSPLGVPDLRARTLLMSDGTQVTRAAWSVMNRREAALAVSLPPGSEVLTAFVDGEPVRLGLKNAREPAGLTVRLPAVEPSRATSATPVTTGLVGLPATAPATPSWVELTVPLRQDPDRPANLEITYRQPVAILGSRDQLSLALPRTQGDITQLKWDVDVPAGWLPRVTAPGLKVGEPFELKSTPATASATSTRATTGVARFDLPEPASGTRIPLAADSLKAGATPVLELTTVSLGFQQIARAVVFLLTLLALADLFWIGFGATVTIGAGVALAGTVLVSLLLGLSVMGQVVAGVVAALTFKLMRILMDPVEEKETP